MSDLLSLPKCFETPAGLKLGALSLIADGHARAFVIKTSAARFHGFIVRRDEVAFGYLDRCPHAGLPLAQMLDAYLTPDGSMIQCSWHGALFDVESGACLGGPCAGSRLRSWPVSVEDGLLVTAAS